MNRSLKNIYEKQQKIAFGLGVVGKNSSAHKYKYVDIEKMFDILNPILSDLRCAIYNSSKIIDGQLFLETKLVCIDTGESVESMTAMYVAGSNMMQASGSAITYARRYNLYQLFNVITADDDAEDAFKFEASEEDIKPLCEEITKKVDKLSEEKKNGFNNWLGAKYSGKPLSSLTFKELKSINKILK